jgi:hypothetical protein
MNRVISKAAHHREVSKISRLYDDESWFWSMNGETVMISLFWSFPGLTMIQTLPSSSRFKKVVTTAKYAPTDDFSHHSQGIAILKQIRD